MISRNKLYALVCSLSLAGYAWIIISHFKKPTHNVGICLVKNVSGIPCPSCGTTRSVMFIFNGDYFQGLMINPLGYLMILLAAIIPVWVTIDIVTKGHSFYEFFKITESFLIKKWVYIPLSILLLINWIWNIHKEL
jgi:hypothetical protein